MRPRTRRVVRRPPARSRVCRFPTHPENPDSAGNVLQYTLALVNKVDRELSIDVLMNAVTYKHATRFGHGLQPGGDIDPVSEYVFLVSQDIPEVDPHAEGQPTILGNVLVPIGRRSLEVNGAADRFDWTREFRQEPVPGGFEDAAPVSVHRWPDDVGQYHLQALVGVLFVAFHQAAVARDISG